MKKSDYTLKSEFAKTCAEAYYCQYIDDDPVDGTPTVIFDRETEKFSWQSSETPLLSSEVKITTVEQGDYGCIDDDWDSKEVREVLVNIIMSDSITLGMVIRAISF